MPLRDKTTSRASVSPFERVPPYSVYVPHQQQVQIKAESYLELAVCRAPSQGNLPVRLIEPKDVGVEKRGYGNNKRLVHNILPETETADALLVVEVFTDEGNTSSFPSHKHDDKNSPTETYLEETYYHRFSPSQGFALQRVYTDDRSLDECMAVYDGASSGHGFLAQVEHMLSRHKGGKSFITLAEGARKIGRAHV